MRVVLAVAGVLYALVFVIRAAELVDVEAADSLLAAPIALIAVAFGPVGGVLGGLAAAAVFAGAEASDTADLTWDEVAVRAVGFAALGSFVGAVAAVLERARARWAGAFDNAPHGILLTDGDGRVAAANSAVAELLARPPETLVGTTLTRLSYPLDIGVDETQWQAVRSGAILSYTAERQLLGAGGEPVPVLMAVSRMPTRGEDVAVIVHLVDLRAQRQSEQRAAYLADHDPLTELFNRNRFGEELRLHLQRVNRHGASGAVLLLDVDHFRYVNDALGHTVGDTVLRAVAEGLSQRLRGEDVLARLGGDEFAMLLPDVRNATDLRTAADGLLAAVDAVRVPLPDQGPGGIEEVHVSGSIGAVLVPAFADIGGLLTAAELAMYEAKEAGPGHVGLHSADSPHANQIRAGFTWGERLRRALAEGRLELHLQPIVSLTGGSQSRYEVLLRLRDGDRLWLPGEFLRHAERLGMMIDIDRFVVAHSIQLLGELPADRRPHLEVNLSAASLGEAHLSDWIAGLLQQNDVPSHYLILEITETVAIANLRLAAATIRRLRARGCGFALDDFGVGVSSFYYLRELPLDVLKIDGEFVRDLATNHANQLIVRAMIDTAHGLGKVTVAEYVGSQEVADILHELGCDYAQGEVFGMAKPAVEMLHP